MTYNQYQLFEVIDARLTACPGLRLQAVAQEFGVNRHTVEKAIRQARGISFREYQQDFLLRKAIDLLLHEPNLSIKQLAGELGYRSPKSFWRFIKRASGKSPSEIQRTSVALLLQTRDGAG